MLPSPSVLISIIFWAWVSIWLPEDAVISEHTCTKGSELNTLTLLQNKMACAQMGPICSYPPLPMPLRTPRVPTRLIDSRPPSLQTVRRTKQCHPEVTPMECRTPEEHPPSLMPDFGTEGHRELNMQSDASLSFSPISIIPLGLGEHSATRGCSNMGAYMHREQQVECFDSVVTQYSVMSPDGPHPSKKRKVF
ncbi:UNVERIFIED_CONTAM: hypothetical protein K2H54_048721 [Gekko kuhli]